MKRFVYAFLATICSLSSLSFADGRSDQERFNGELSRLGLDFDKRQEVGEGDSDLYLSNSLSEEDKARFKPYVTKQSNGLLALSDNIYKVFPVSNTVIDPSNPFPGVGGGDTISPWKPPVNGNLPGLPTVATLTALAHEDFEENQKKIDFVHSNIALMNDLASQGYGTIDEEGTFQASSNDHYIQQDFIMNFRIEWFEMKFTAN